MVKFSALFPMLSPFFTPNVIHLSHGTAVNYWEQSGTRSAEQICLDNGESFLVVAHIQPHSGVREI